MISWQHSLARDIYPVCKVFNTKILIVSGISLYQLLCHITVYPRNWELSLPVLITLFMGWEKTGLYVWTIDWYPELGWWKMSYYKAAFNIEEFAISNSHCTWQPKSSVVSNFGIWHTENTCDLFVTLPQSDSIHTSSMIIWIYWHFYINARISQ